MMSQSHPEICMAPVEGILCVQYLLNRDNDVLKDDVVLGQMVFLVPCKLVENPRCKTCPMYSRLKTVILFS